LRVRSDDASVRVLATDGDRVEFHATTEGAEWGLMMGRRPKIDSRQAGDLVELEARAHWNGMLIGYSNKRMTIEVRMPRNADLELTTGDGAVELSSLNGNVVVHTSDGGIRAAQLSGRIELRSSDGGITADTLHGDLKLHTSDGRIRAANLDGRCEASSSDGSIQVAGRFDFLDVRSGDGSITARVESGSQISSQWSLRTSDGSVHLALPKDFKANLDASTGDGHISSELPVEIQGELTHRRIHGTMNGGGPAVTIHTGDGSIDLAAT
jgi:DUF4097 and DUF4098 domain-containing protein YvlB